MKYAKLKNNNLKYAPINVEYNSNFIINPNKDILNELGYLPVINTDSEEKEGYSAITYYEIEDNQIIQKWKYEEIIIEPSTEERLAILEDAFTEFVSEVLNND